MKNGADGVFLIIHEGNFDHNSVLIYHYEAVRDAFPDLYIGLNFLGTRADKAYEMLPQGAQALWTDDGISGSGTDKSMSNLYTATNG